MPDQAPSFEHSALEADIEHLAAEIKKHKELPETKNLAEKELLRRAISAMPERTGSAPQSADKGRASPLPAYAQDAPAEIRLEIEYLLDIAFHKGIAYAVSAARKSPDFVQDAFHDALVGKLYPELKKRGLI